MIRSDDNTGLDGTGLPRTRGDDPVIVRQNGFTREFAPHARG